MKPSKIIYYGFVALFTLLCFYVSIEIVIALKKELPVSLFSYSISYVPTNSMEDEIMPGDYVLFKKADFDDVKEESIIVYKSKTGEMAGNFIIHRIIEDHGDYYITKGDNNPLPDTEHITADMIVGEYICVVGFIGGISSNKTLLTVLVFMFILLIFGCQFVSNYVKKKQEEIKQQNQVDKQELIEQLKKEILEEELEKIRNSKK